MNLISQLGTTDKHLSSPDPLTRLVPLIHWTFFAILISLYVYISVKKEPKQWIFKLILVIIQLRILLPLLDLERRRDKLSSLELVSQFNYNLVGIIVCQILLNLVFSKWVGTLMTIGSTACIQYGLLRWTNPNKDMIVVVEENIASLTINIFLVIIFLCFCSFYLLIHN